MAQLTAQDVPGTIVETVNEIRGTVLQFDKAGYENLALVRSHDDNLERWYNCYALTVIARPGIPEHEAQNEAANARSTIAGEPR